MAKWSKDDDIMLDMMDMISSPVITYAPQWWSGGIPMNLAPKIQMDKIMYSIMKKKEATDSEVVGYLNTASCEFPLSRDWYEVYMECFSKCFPEMAKQIDPEHKGISDYQRTHMLQPLKNWIYKKRREIMKERVKKYNQSQETDFPQHVEVKNEQLSLFDIIEREGL